MDHTGRIALHGRQTIERGSAPAQSRLHPARAAQRHGLQSRQAEIPAPDDPDTSES